MQAYDHTNEQEHYFNDSIKELSKLNKKISELLLKKEEITDKIISSLDHNHEGQKTYEYGRWKIEIKTPVIYSLNKKLYESSNVKLPDNFNPIKTSVSYSLDKRLVDKYITEAPSDIRDLLIELIDKKPGKAAVTIKDRV